MNPATAELLAAVEATNAEEVILLPNNANVILAAEQAAELSERPVRVVPTRSLQAGLAALVAFNQERTAAENAAEMSRALEEIVTGEVAVAVREASIGRLHDPQRRVPRPGRRAGRCGGPVVRRGRARGRGAAC